MAADNEVVIQITLDDGSIVKGLGRVKKELKDTGDEANDTAQTLGDVLNGDVVGSFTNKLKEIPLAFAGFAAAAVAAGTAVKQAFDLSLVGEQLKATQLQFENFASQAGINAQELQSALERSGQGLVGVDDLLKASTSAIINLGDNARALPQILDLARNSAKALGGDIQTNFELIVRAVESGNTKLLKSVDIYVDSESAIKKYKEQIGLTTGELNQAQKQQAILNELLTTGSSRFSGVEKSATPLKDSITQIGVALNDVYEEFSKFVNSNFGQFFLQAAQDTARALRILTGAGDEASKTKDKIKELELELQRLQSTASSSGDTGEFDFLAGDRISKATEAAITRTKEQINTLKSQLTELQKTSTFTPTVGGLDTNQLKAEKQKQVENLAVFNQQLLALQQDSAQIRLNQAITDEQKYQAQLDLDVQNRYLKYQQDNDNYSKLLSEKKITQDQYQELSKASFENLSADLLRIGETLNVEEKRLQQQRLQTAQQINSQVNNALVQSTTAAINQMVLSLRTGKAGWEELGKSVASIIGDMLVSIGQSMVAIGIATTALGQSLATLSGGTAIAAGVGLIALGSLLKASVGSALTNAATSGATGGFSPSGGGVLANNDSPIINVAQDTQPERRAQTEVVFNIQGDILDAEETGVRFVDLINKAVDARDVKIRRGALA